MDNEAGWCAGRSVLLRCSDREKGRNGDQGGSFIQRSLRRCQAGVSVAEQAVMVGYGYTDLVPKT